MKPHKDLPGGSQDWAAEVDAMATELRQLREVVKRLSANAGLDYSNPSRGVNTGDTPSVLNPVGQKLSSLADVKTYNVADGQYLSWSQQGQQWLPATLPTPTAGGTIDISAVSYAALTEGYGEIVDSTNYAYTAAGVVGTDPFAHQYVETWATGAAYYGMGDFSSGTGHWTLIEMDADGFGRPYIQLNANDDADGTFSNVVLSSYSFRVEQAAFVVHRCSTAARPTWLTTSSTHVGGSVYDTTLNIPIWWNGTTWTNALGTAV